MAYPFSPIITLLRNLPVNNGHVRRFVAIPQESLSTTLLDGQQCLGLPASRLWLNGSAGHEFIDTPWHGGIPVGTQGYCIRARRGWSEGLQLRQAAWDRFCRAMTKLPPALRCSRSGLAEKAYRNCSI